MLGLLQVLGWVGGGAVVIAYVLLSVRRLTPDSTSFQMLNITGAALLGLASLQQGALPSAGMNLVWVVVGAHALATKGARRRRVVGWSTEADPANLDIRRPPHPASPPYSAAVS